MKRFSVLVLVLCASFVPVAWAQQENVPRFGRHRIPGHGRFIAIQGTNGTMGRQGFSAESFAAHNTEVWDLGTYPGGTWAEAGGINDFGVAVALGDTGPNGPTHLFTIQLSGPHAPRWSDLGPTNAYEGWFAWPSIADTGLIVGYAATPVGAVHGFLWVGKHVIDLGTLADIGYTSYDNSEAAIVNKRGTLIAGGATSSSEPGAGLPVVWTLDSRTHTWKIHKLDTAGFPCGFALGVNDSGQVAGAFFDDAGTYVAALWNPIPGKEEWKAIKLPGSLDWPVVAIAGDINEKGEIVGDVLSSDWVNGYSSLWQPLDPMRRTYKLTLLPNYYNGANGDTAEGINDLGDIVGGTWDGDGTPHAARWSTKDTNLVQLLDFPGDYSVAYKVNESRIATGLYGGGACANECALAVRIH
jgi:probable HAF family extracellular repeat protein